MDTANKNKGVIKKKPLMQILNRKVELRKELIELKKEHENTKKQEELIEDIKIIDEFLSSHRIQK
jgi:hypothetical protein|tara:strand:+ start:5220 stop:5414 length:195 start_codon:yes stop_codon:yes gene_type:complete